MSDSVPVGAAPDVWDIAAPSVPNSARMYDYYLGGKDNFPVDREAAEKAVAAMPVIPVLARANRAFLVDSVGKMAAAGIRQYLDVGSGLPTSPNVHEVARETVPDARVVAFAEVPVLLAGELPEGQEAFQVIVAPFFGVGVDEPLDADGCAFRTSRGEPGQNGVVGAGVCP